MQGLILEGGSIPLPPDEGEGDPAGSDDDPVGVSFEFEPFEDHKPLWPLIRANVKMVSAANPVSCGMLALDGSDHNTTIVHRYRSESDVASLFSKYLGREWHDSDEEWDSFSSGVGVFHQYARTTSIVVVGVTSPDALGIIRRAAVMYGWATPRVLATPQLPWVSFIIHSGMAVACLSLTSNWAASVQPSTVGQTLSYRVRDTHYDEASGQRTMLPITPAFEFEVLAVFGEGGQGRAVAFRALGGDDAVIIAFRGVRVDPVKDMVSDSRALCDSAALPAPWLKGRAARHHLVHRGTLECTSRRLTHKCMHISCTLLHIDCSRTCMARTDGPVPHVWCICGACAGTTRASGSRWGRRPRGRPLRGQGPRVQAPRGSVWRASPVGLSSGRGRESRRRAGRRAGRRAAAAARTGRAVSCAWWG